MPHLTPDATIRHPLRLGEKVAVCIDGRFLPELAEVVLVSEGGAAEDILTGAPYRTRASVMVRGEIPWLGPAIFAFDPASGFDLDGNPGVWVSRPTRRRARA